jgi:hypothetical protein
MLEILCEFLDTASTYTKYNEYLFWINKFQYFMHLQFKFEASKYFNEKKKLMKYTKII